MRMSRQMTDRSSGSNLRMRDEYFRSVNGRVANETVQTVLNTTKPVRPWQIEPKSN